MSKVEKKKNSDKVVSRKNLFSFLNVQKFSHTNIKFLIFMTRITLIRQNEKICDQKMSKYTLPLIYLSVSAIYCGGKSSSHPVKYFT